MNDYKSCHSVTNAIVGLDEKAESRWDSSSGDHVNPHQSIAISPISADDIIRAQKIQSLSD